MKPTQQEISVWDLFIRVFHWSFAGLFLLDFWVLEDGGSPHEWVGYIIGFLLLMRVIWGFIGSNNARFSTFFPTLAGIKKHFVEMHQRRIDPAEGHNPVGALMVFFLLFMVGVSVLSGWMLTWDMFWGEEWVEEFHEIIASLTMLAVVVHVSAVVILGKVLGISLVGAMITGKRKHKTRRKR